MAGPTGINAARDVRLSRGGNLTGLVDGPDLTCSFWFSIPSLTGADEYVYANSQTNNFIRFVFADGTIFIRFQSPSPFNSTLLQMKLSGIPYDTDWHNVCFSRKGGVPPTVQAYLDDQPIVPSITTNSNGDIGFERLQHYVLDGPRISHEQGYDGGISQLYLNFAEFIDLDITAERRKLVGFNALESVDYGVDGSTPTGNAPVMFFEGAPAAWPTNLGTGGGFTLEDGPLTDAATDPPPYGATGNNGNGILIATEAMVSGVATKSQTVADGVLTADAAAMTGAAARNSDAEGVLPAQEASVAGDADVIAVQQAYAALAAQAAAVAGDATTLERWIANGAPTAQAAAVTGDATTLERWAALGALAAQEASISGIATLKHLSFGAPVAQPAIVQGQAVLRHFSAGALVAQAAAMRSRATAGDGWSDPEGGGETETWAPVGKGAAEGWQPVDTGGNETWR